MKVKMNIIALIATVLLLLSSLTLVYAFFKSTKKIENIEFTTGVFFVELQGSLINDDYLVPGKELVAVPYMLINNSSINIDILMILEVTIDGNPLDLATYSNEDGTPNDLIVITGNYQQNGNQYLFENINPNQNINIIDSLIFNGFIVRNDYSDSLLEIKIRFLAKQHEYADDLDWEDIGTLDLP